MAAWLSALVFGGGLMMSGPLLGAATSVCTIHSLRDIHPKQGDLVVLDIDDTLIRPVHSVMGPEGEKVRNWWRPLLPIGGDRLMSLAWCQDGRELMERSSAQTIRAWRSQGVKTLAMTKRQQELPWGADMAIALARQLRKLGIEFRPSRSWNTPMQPDALFCSNGQTKHPYILRAVEELVSDRQATVWIVDDRPEAEWQTWQPNADFPPVVVAHFLPSIGPNTSVGPLYEVLEFGFFLKTGRWLASPRWDQPTKPRAAGFLARRAGL